MPKARRIYWRGAVYSSHSALADALGLHHSAVKWRSYYDPQRGMDVLRPPKQPGRKGVPVYQLPNGATAEGTDEARRMLWAWALCEGLVRRVTVNEDSSKR